MVIPLQTRTCLVIFSLSLGLMSAGTVAATNAATVLQTPFPNVEQHTDLTPAAFSGPVVCPPVPKPVITLATGSIYKPDDPNHADIDDAAQAAYQQAIKPARAFIKQIIQQANRFVVQPMPSEGRCALRWLAAWAKAEALTDMQTVQAEFGRGSLLSGLALAYLQLRDQTGIAAATDKADIERWLGQLAEDAIRFFERRPQANSSRANHRYWNGLAVAAVGIATNSNKQFTWGVESYRLAIAQIQADGTLPLELARGKRARDYHLYALAPLINLAEMGAANGLTLYAENNGAIHRLVGLVLSSIDDPRYLATLTGEPQIAFPGHKATPPKHRLAWLEPYFARFPSPTLQQRLTAWRPLYATNLGGDLNLLYGSQHRPQKVIAADE